MVSVLIIAMAALLLAACIKIERLQERERDWTDRKDLDHQTCLDAVMWNMRREFAALVLTDAADTWDSVENRTRLEQMRRNWLPGEDGIAAQWMREQAARWLDTTPGWTRIND